MDDKRQLAPNDDRTDGNDGYTNPIARKGEQQFACIMRNRSGVSSGEIDFGARFIDRLCDGDQQSAVDSAFAIYEKWSRETGKVAQRDTRKSLEKDFAYHAELCTSQQASVRALTAEVEEQARLLGASGSREAELLARVGALEKSILMAATRAYDAINESEEHMNEAVVEIHDSLAPLLQEPSP